jgi:hypothetical protein
LCSSLQCLLCSSRSRSPKDGRRDFLCLLCNQVASPARTFTARRLRQKRIIPLCDQGWRSVLPHVKRLVLHVHSKTDHRF